MSKGFKKVYIEISDICGLKCSFCPSPKGRRGVMDLGLFEKICKELEGRCERIDLHLLGDPLKCKNFPDFLHIASKFAHKIEIVTSGYYLDQWDFALLLSAPIVQLNISLSAYTDKENPKRENYLQNCLALAHFHQKQSSKCFVNFRMHKSRLDETISQIFTQKFGVEHSFKGDRIKLGEYLFLRLSKDFEWIDSDAPLVQKEKFCYGLREQIGILSDGRVVPCCIDCDGVITLGNLKEMDLNEILSSNLSKEIIQGFQKGIAYHSHCQKCTYPAKIT